MLSSTMPPRCRSILGAIWLVFLIRGAFYCQLIPLWEGYDEWAHYAFLEHLRLHPGSLPSTSDGVTEEIRQSVLSAQFRHEVAEPLRSFEAQQPPLYYWVLSIPNRVWIGVDISTRVHRLRVLSILIASLVIPLAWLAALELFHNRALALSVCALIASMPELMIDVARVANESLAIALASWITLLLLRKKAPALGLAMGLALLTKAYFLAILPILIFRRRIYSLAIAIGISGWWYWRNWRLTGTLSGEVIDRAASNLGLGARLGAIGKVHWLSVLDGAAWTHIWNGAWSFLAVKTWIYRVFELIFLVVAIMLVSALLKRPFGHMKGKLALMGALEGLFALGISYQTLAMFLVRNLSFAGGWYYYALVVSEALLLASGLLILAGRRRVLYAMGFLTFLFLALDVYTAFFVLLPYYRR
jgi:hypothetical protein